ncbi:MAG: hypothetical protein HOH37_06625, partial [Gammaproteobacteria bacterium]|nr:hypothetical protein [Gammaproteobacteria bacterium]
AALESVTYQNVNDSFPNPGDRTVSFVTNDGVADSAAVTSIVKVTDVNEAPVLNLGAQSGVINYEPQSGAVIIDNSLNLTDLDSATIKGAVIAINSGFVPGEDVLAFTNTNDITGSWDANSGVLTLFGSASTAAYKAALESVTYNNTAASTTLGSIQVSWRVNDGTSLSPAVTSVIGVNYGPTLSGINSTLTFTEGGAAQVIDSSISVLDTNDANIQSATITISGGYVASEDVLAFTNANGITGAWNSSSGTLTLSGSAPKGAYATALESVTYQNTNNGDPNNASRTVTWVVNDGSANSSPVTSAVTVVDVNDLPVVSGVGGTLSFTEGDAPTVIDNNLSLSDVDGTTISSAVVHIISGFQVSEDVLAFTDANGITGNFMTYESAVAGSESSNAILWLTGVATIADYQAALESVTYHNTNTSNPNTDAQLVRWVIFEENNGMSEWVTSTVTVTAINDVPVLAGAAGTLLFSEGGAAAVIDSDLSLTDVDDTKIEGATIKLTGFVENEDVLAFSNTAEITGSWDSVTGILTLSGSATKAQYESALETVTFQNINTDDPNNGDRKVLWSVNDGDVDSISATTTISVIDINDVPMVTGAGGTLPFVDDGTAAVIDSSLSLSDEDNTNIAGATIAISDGYIQNEDVLAFTNANGITGVWDAESGKLTLSGPATIAVYEAALESVTYQNLNDAGPNPLTRTVSWIIEDGT